MTNTNNSCYQVRARIDRYSSGQVTSNISLWRTSIATVSASYGTNAGNKGQMYNNSDQTSSWYTLSAA